MSFVYQKKSNHIHVWVGIAYGIEFQNEKRINW